MHKQVAPVHSVLCAARDTHLADGTFVDALLLTSGRRDDLLISDQLGRERVVALDGRSVVTRHGKNAGDQLIPVLRVRSSSFKVVTLLETCLLYTSPSPLDGLLSRMPSSA